MTSAVRLFCCNGRVGADAAEEGTAAEVRDAEVAGGWSTLGVVTGFNVAGDTVTSPS